MLSRVVGSGLVPVIAAYLDDGGPPFRWSDLRIEGGAVLSTPRAGIPFDLEYKGPPTMYDMEWVSISYISAWLSRIFQRLGGV
jgi:hypothetical protein